MANKEAMLKYLLSILIFSFSFSSLACGKIKTAYNHLLSANFTVDKNFIITMDGKKKIELTNHIKYQSGILKHSKNNISFIADDFKYEEDDSEHFLKYNLTCNNFKIKGEQVVVTSTQDDKNYSTYFHYNSINGTLSPIKTIIKGEVSMLFMSWKITSIENYSSFRLL